MKASASPRRATTAPQRPGGRKENLLRWRLALPLLAALAGAAAWKWTPLSEVLEPGAVAAWAAPHRDAWYAIPVSIAAFVILGFLLVPVLLMILVTGMIFGPWIGALCAMAGCLGSAAAGFGTGRLLGRDAVNRFGKEAARELAEKLERHGILAVFIIRKIPAPFTMVNIVTGASPIRFRDFLIGTFLGMGPMVILVSVLGWQLLESARKPSPASLAATLGLALAAFGVALSLQILIARRRKNK